MSDLICRQAAIDALKNDMASLDHIIKGMSAMDVRLDAYVSQRNQVNYDIYTINNLPPAHGTNLASLGTDCISRQQAIDALDQIFDRCEEIEAHLPEGDPDRTGYKMYPDYMTVWKYLHQLPPAQPEIVRCKDCKYRYVDGDNVRYNACELNHNNVQSDDWFCADGEKREVTT